MEKDYFKDRHPNCYSLKSVQEHLYKENGDVFICEKDMQTIATELSDLTRVTILAILSNGDHPRGLKVKGIDKYGHVKIGRITYFVYNESILTKNGLIEINKILYKDYFYYHLYFNIDLFQQLIISFDIPNLFFKSKDDAKKNISYFNNIDVNLFEKLLILKSDKLNLNIKDNILYYNTEIQKINSLDLFKILSNSTNSEIFHFNLYKIQLKQFRNDN